MIDLQKAFDTARVTDLSFQISVNAEFRKDYHWVSYHDLCTLIWNHWVSNESRIKVSS